MSAFSTSASAAQPPATPVRSYAPPANLGSPRPEISIVASPAPAAAGAAPLPPPAARLRLAIAAAQAEGRCLLVPACHDALSAALIERAGFSIAFMSGFAVSATQLALPDAGLISFDEMLRAGRDVCSATSSLAVIGDGDTGFGAAANVRRTIRSYAQAGFAGISIEDQSFPKRCSHARGLAVVPRAECVARVRSALAARDELRAATGADLVVIARTDCRKALAHGGMEEVLWRCQAFVKLGADVVYAEGMEGEEEHRAVNALLSGAGTPSMLAQVERLLLLLLLLLLVLTPLPLQVERPGFPMLSAEHAAARGFCLSLQGLTLLNVATKAMKQALAMLSAGNQPNSSSMIPFDELYTEVGFDSFNNWSEKYDEDTHSHRSNSNESAADEFSRRAGQMLQPIKPVVVDVPEQPAVGYLTGE